MRTVAILLLTGAGLWAQRPAVSPSGYGRILFPGGGGPSPSATAVPQMGAGRILFPGTGAPAVPRNTGFTFVGGPLPLANPPLSAHPRHSQPVVVPYPVFLGGGYYAYDPPQAELISNYVPVQAPQQEPSPVVIVNQYFRGDQPETPQVSRNAPLEAPAAAPEAPQMAAVNPDKDIIYLIAMKDHTIYAASAYWVEDNTLNYITIQGSENSVSMDLVDRELSQRLNRDRRVAFGLPRP